MKLLHKNIELNKRENCTIQCERLLWGEDLEQFQQKTANEFDIIFGSDIIYSAAWTDVLDPLWRTICSLLKDSSDARFLCCYQERAEGTTEYFLKGERAHMSYLTL
eukprot:TRINITY_DN11495_c0_g1_i1.p1 TRINITY_DN11495_c0_g1~~TRINITY_DN11495_c0_g1_i1.p1  ORF type:complete len:106 (-),score=15.43 TRINITY_DN11495_c0_g1_i1:215-532(-)